MNGRLRRNERCFCGSGKRFKHCHGAWSINNDNDPILNWRAVPQRVRDAFDMQQLARVRGYDAFGLQRPIVAAADGRDRFIVCGDRLLHWPGGGNFLNFLENDLLQRMGERFRNDSVHPLNIWWRAMRDQAHSRHCSGKHTLASTVAVMNFFTVAYDLFVVSDNSTLRERLLKSLRITHQFHGARYELMIAACLVRAGFAIEFSNEEVSDKRHSDGSALHRRTGRRYSVEMKAKGRNGILGKPGQKPLPEAMSCDVSRLLRDAVAKPADNERLIFIDMNLPFAPNPKNELWWQHDAIASVRAFEKQPGRAEGCGAGFVLFTNSPAHHMPLHECYVGPEVAFTAFNRPGFAADLPRLGDICPDIADLFDAFRIHDKIPDSF
jgi:hypothetical protein